MRESLKTTLHDWFQVKVIVFGLALFNFELIWTLVQSMGNIAALVDPWFRPWSYWNEPSRLLLAAFLLLVGRSWSYLAAIGLTGYMVLRFAYLFAIWDGPWVLEWTYLGTHQLYFVGSYESQILLATIILSVGLYYLGRDYLRPTVVESAAANTRLERTI
jgi:hypothetical protein